MTHGTKLAEIDFTVFLTIFEYAESNAERCQAQLFMQKLEFYDLKLVSKIARKSLKNRGVSKLLASTRRIHAALYVTNRMRRAKINFTMFLTIFEYAKSNAERCQAQLFMQRLEFYDLKLVSKIARKSLKNRGVSKLWASTRHIHAALYVTHRMRRAKINFTMFLTIFGYAESNAE